MYLLNPVLSLWTIGSKCFWPAHLMIWDPVHHKAHVSLLEYIQMMDNCYLLAIRSKCIQTVFYRFTHDSIMSLDISFSRVSRCLPNSSSGQWRSLMKVCRASSFQKRSSDVPEPWLQGHKSKFSIKRQTLKRGKQWCLFSIKCLNGFFELLH